jgi:BlaI family penicillinase repressor
VRQFQLNIGDKSTMKKTASASIPQPTEAELEILQLLWTNEPCTVRDIHDALHVRGGTGYTTALKLLQVMHAKGLVKRDDSQRAHVYRAAVSKERTQESFMVDMLQRVFEGSSSQLVLHALGMQRASRAELDSIRLFLNKIDKDAP